MRRHLPGALARLMDRRSRLALLLTLGAWVALACWMQPARHGHASSFASSLSMWMLMVVATSPILLDETLKRLFQLSLPRMRLLTAIAFCLGYMVSWAAAGFFLLPVLGWFQTPAAVLLAAVAIAGWQCSPARQQCLNACHKAPCLRAFGTAALRDATASGLVTGVNCAAACGPLMVLPFLAGRYQVLAMAVAAVAMIVERKMLSRRPRWQVPFFRSLARELRSLPTPDPRWRPRELSPAS